MYEELNIIKINKYAKTIDKPFNMFGDYFALLIYGKLIYYPRNFFGSILHITKLDEFRRLYYCIEYPMPIPIGMIKSFIGEVQYE